MEWLGVVGILNLVLMILIVILLIRQEMKRREQDGAWANSASFKGALSG